MLQATTISAFAVAAAATVAVDQASKALVHTHLPEGEQRPLVPGLVNLNHYRNDGISFSLASGSGTAFSVAGAIGVPLLGAWFIKSGARALPVAIGAGLFMGGAIGNLVDRVRSGAVTDFIELPGLFTFNLADVAINVGVVAMAAGFVMGKR